MTRWFSALAFFLSAGLAQAATIELAFTGTAYSDTEYERTNRIAVDRTDVIGPYRSVDSVSGLIVLEGVLPTNAILTISEGAVLAEDANTGQSITGISFQSMTFTDGLLEYGAEDLAYAAEIETDVSGNIIAWDFSFLPDTSSSDFRTLDVTSYAGDAARFQSEFLVRCRPADAADFGSPCAFGPTTAGSESASASTAVAGAWNVSAVVAPVPLPAGSPLLLTGLGVFALSRRHDS